MTDEVLDTASAERAPVDEGQTQESQPDVKDDAPEAPAKAPSAREALEKAFGNGAETVPTAEEKAAAEAKAEEAKAPKPEAKLKPEAKAEPKQDGPQRAPDGKFAPKEGEKAPEKPQEADQAPKSDTAKAPHHAAPSRFSADAKAEWEKAPESVRAEVHRAIRENEKGIEKYRQRAEPMEPFHKMAEQAGRPLHDIVGEFVQFENALRQDPVRGFAQVAQRMGLSPQQVGQALLGQQPGQQDPRDQQIMQLTQVVQQLQQGYGQINQTFEDQRRNTVMGQIEQFAASNEHFTALEGDIAQLLHAGEADTLEDAYAKALSRAQEMAARFAPQQVETPPPAAPAQTREARSLTGAPSPGSNPTTKRTPPKNARDALKRHLLG